ncbi:GNAT family N-acetyltransferase [Bradyrhizobium sp. 2TAF24]|uniref:GNAT family N-acetyltransferase n=1 Tax=Bradyrhizobium sp. 2TAF24 TaxID=3233011 RepID=UPI003F8E730E
MRIDIIDRVETFHRLRDNWNAVYDADADAQLFLSWEWLAGWLPNLSTPWVILAARDDQPEDAPYVAFFPLRFEVKADAAGHLTNELKMAGSYAADYTGLIARPDAEARAIAAFVRQIRQLHWASFSVDNFRGSALRFRQLLAHFSQATFVATPLNRVNAHDQVDNAICPYAQLPPDWNAYLDTLSANTRQKIRRLLKLVDCGDAYHITHTTAATVQNDLRTLLKFWEARWRSRKGDSVEALVRSNFFMLLRSFERGLLHLPVLWHGDRPLAALATLMDARKRAFLFYITGRDETFDGPPPGLILHGHSIRHAIANGFTRYDFLRGNERYKYSFGVSEERLHCHVIATRDHRNLGGKLDPHAVAGALKLATERHQAGKLAEAEIGYRQILETAPRDDNTLHRFGQLLATKGDHRAAKRIFARLIEVRPDTFKPRLCLGQSCEALGQFSEAADAYREVARLQPDAPGIAGLLSRALLRAGRNEEALRLVASGAAAQPPIDGIPLPQDMPSASPRPPHTTAPTRAIPA